MIMRRSKIILSLWLDDHSGAVGYDFAHGLADFRGVELHTNDSVGTHGGRVLYHAINSVTARFLQQFGIFNDLATRQRTQSSHDVPAQAATAHNHAEDLAFCFNDA